MSTIKNKSKLTAEDLGVKKVYLESGIEVNPIYTAEDIEKSNSKHEMPGEYPFTRGIHLTAYVHLNKDLSQEKIINLYEQTYANAPFAYVCSYRLMIFS